jgi:hypothetical protein
LVDDVRPVAEQSTVVDEKPQGVDGRQPMPCRQCNDQRAKRSPRLTDVTDPATLLPASWRGSGTRRGYRS